MIGAMSLLKLSGPSWTALRLAKPGLGAIEDGRGVLERRSNAAATTRINANVQGSHELRRLTILADADGGGEESLVGRGKVLAESFPGFWRRLFRLMSILDYTSGMERCNQFLPVPFPKPGSLNKSKQDWYGLST
jgi:hypothetical protein